MGDPWADFHQLGDRRRGQEHAAGVAVGLPGQLQEKRCPDFGHLLRVGTGGGGFFPFPGAAAGPIRPAGHVPHRGHPDSGGVAGQQQGRGNVATVHLLQRGRHAGTVHHIVLLGHGHAGAVVSPFQGNSAGNGGLGEPGRTGDRCAAGPVDCDDHGLADGLLRCLGSRFSCWELR